VVVGLWILYKLIFQLVIPVYRSTRIMRAKFREMQQHMQQEMNQQTNSGHSSDRQGEKTDASQGDYIEFEEVK
jgi:hypothetical protein